MTIETTLSASLPLRPIPLAGLARRLRSGWPALLILLGWESLALLEALADYVDAIRKGHPAALSHLLLTVLPEYLPLVLNSWVLAWTFTRWQDTVLRPAALLLALGLTMATFLPLLTGVDIVIVALSEGRAIDNFSALLAQAGRLTWWYNIFVVGLAFLAQVGFTAWRRGQRQELDAQRAQTEHLQLRLGLLQGQLKPHFLFNALNSISALMRTADGALAGQALDKLEDLLKRALAAGKGQPSSVADEIEFLRAYLDLQALRYGDRMRLTWEIEARDWSRIACPPLLFQPLAENAVQHGVEPHHEAGCIHIALKYEAGMVDLRIANPVLAPAVAGHGMGLNMTRERLAILYGPRADLQIDANEQHYAIQLRFPA